MTTLNTIIEEEKNKFRDLYLTESPDKDGAITTSSTFNWAKFDITQKQEKIAYYLMTQEGIEDSFTTAMQRAYEAGKADWLRSEIEKFEVTQREHFCTPENGNDYDHGAWDVYDSIITRYKEELKVLESK